MKKKCIANCKVFSKSNNFENCNVLISDGKILDIISSEHFSDSNYEFVDGKNKIVIPGLIDVHIQGAGGADILDSTEEAIQTVSKTLAKLGTTSYLATTVVNPAKGNEHLKLVKKFYNKKGFGAQIVGVHLEGPFINEIKKGGLNPSGIYSSDKHNGLNGILEVTGESLKMMTIAPELKGNGEIIRQIREHNIIAAFAHSDANYKETKKGFEYGINHVTHLFNAMRPMTHRDPGPLPAIFENNNITAQIISDGHHIHPTMIKHAYKNLGIDRCILITDGIQGMGLPEGKYKYNGKDYITKDGAARYLDGTLIGSSMSLLDIALNFMKYTGCSISEAMQTVTYNPAKLLGLENIKGDIKPYADADLLILNEDYSLNSVVIDGEII